MELVGFSERYSSCLHPLCTHVTTVTLLIQIHLTLRSWGSEGCTRPLAGWQEWGEKRVPVHHCLLTPPFSSCHGAGTGATMDFSILS